MTRITIGEDCGNSPKNLFVQELTVAFAKGDAKFLLARVTDDVRWNLVGGRLVEGRENFAQALERGPALELTVLHIATHGRVGAVDGTLRREDGTLFAFCDVYEFENAKGTSVKAITSYRVELT